ncbi:hypothetical protein ACIQ4I_01750 [Rummeliibacillus sp. NPDC094406]|uniref:hypothetical protein n=1 Tax=Rummeliibacillus sp. NPDC094406 TaxID=3364511 RepID=UPI0037FDED0C
MDNLNVFGPANWIGLLSSVFIILCLYFTLTFFQKLKAEDERGIKQNKFAAIICLAFAILMPALYNLYIFSQMME